VCPSDCAKVLKDSASIIKCRQSAWLIRVGTKYVYVCVEVVTGMITVQKDFPPTEGSLCQLKTANHHKGDGRKHGWYGCYTCPGCFPLSLHEQLLLQGCFLQEAASYRKPS
jgi:hypothetical protein